jgi:hypothetical protein
MASMARRLVVAVFALACSASSHDGGGGAPEGGGGSTSTHNETSSSATGGEPNGGSPTGGSGGASLAGTCVYEPEAACDVDLAADCLCVGCRDECNGAAVSDCLGAVCDDDPFCSDPAACVDDGACDPFNEACHCTDCSGHPLCAPG